MTTSDPFTNETFHSRYGKILSIHWIRASHEIAQPVTAYRDVSRSNHDETTMNPSWRAHGIIAGLSHRSLRGIDVTNPDNNLRGIVLHGFRTSRVGSLDIVWCDPSYRRENLGSRIVGLVFDDLGRRGATSVETECGAYNDVAKIFLRKTGWEDTGKMIGGFEIPVPMGPMLAKAPQ